MTSQRFSLIFDGQMDISQIRSSISSMQSALSKIKLPENLKSNLTKIFSNLTTEVDRFEAKTKESLNSINDVSGAERSLGKIADYYRQLQVATSKVKGLDSKKLFPDEVASNIEKASNALKEYEDAQESIKKRSNEVQAAYDKENQKIEEATKQRERLQELNKQLNKEISKQQTTKSDLKNQLALKQASFSDLAKQGQTRVGQANYLQYQQLKQEISDIESKITDANTVIKGFNNDINKNNREITQYTNVIEASTQELTTLKQTLGQIQTAEPAQALEKLRKALAEVKGVDIGEIPTDLKDIQSVISSLSQDAVARVNDALEEMETNSDQAKAGIGNLGRQMESINTSAVGLKNAAGDVERLKNQVLDFFSLTNTVNLFRRTIRQAYESIKELDEAMTETAVVTDFTVGDMWSRLPEYTAVANELGATTLGAYQVMTLFYQQGTCEI